MISFSLFNSSAFALEQNEASASAYWTGTPLYQGGNATMTVTFVSNSSDQLRIFYVGVHFDWMPADSFVGLDLSENPVNVTSHGSYTFNPMIILIPANTTVGPHSYFIGIDGAQGSAQSFSWNSLTFSLQVEVSDKKLFNQLEIQVTADINQALNASYRNPEAQSLVSLALNDLENARFLGYQEGNWTGGVLALQNATSHLDEAKLIEQGYSGGGDLTTLLIIIGATVVAVVIILLAILFIRRKKKTLEEPITTISEPAPPPQPATTEATTAPQPTSVEGSRPSSGGDTTARLEKLKELRDKNLITKEEYEKKKDEILEQV